MNETDKQTLISKMAIVWPNTKQDVATVMLWRENLDKIRDLPAAQRAVASLMESTPFWPHWSEFMTHYRDELAADRRVKDHTRDLELAAGEHVTQGDGFAKVFESLRKVITPLPSPNPVEVDELLQTLESRWGIFEASERVDWARKFGNLETQVLTETVQQVHTGPGLLFTEFMGVYHTHRDRLSLEQFSGRPAASVGQPNPIGSYGRSTALNDGLKPGERRRTHAAIEYEHLEQYVIIDGVPVQVSGSGMATRRDLIAKYGIGGTHDESALR